MEFAQLVAKTVITIVSTPDVYVNQIPCGYLLLAALPTAQTNNISQMESVLTTALNTTSYTKEVSVCATLISKESMAFVWQAVLLMNTEMQMEYADAIQDISREAIHQYASQLTVLLVLPLTRPELTAFRSANTVNTISMEHVSAVTVTSETHTEIALLNALPLKS